MSVRPSTEQLLVQVVLRSLEDALGALANHSADSPAVLQAVRGLQLSFAPIWSRLPFLDLQCAGSEMRWEGNVVLDVDEDAHGLVPTLTASGIHGMMLLPGVEREEIATLAVLVDRKRRLDEDGDQDLVLDLFRADLRHIRYTVGPPTLHAAPARGTTISDTEVERVSAVSDDLGLPEITVREGSDAPAEQAAPTPNPTGHSDHPRFEIEPLPATEPDGAVRRPDVSSADGADTELKSKRERLDPAQVRALVEEDLESSPRTVDVHDEFGTTHFLAEEEMDDLRAAIEREYERDHARAVLGLLLDTLESQSSPEVRDEVIGVLRDLLPYLLGTGRFPAVAYLTGELRRVARTTKLEPRHKQALDQMRLAVSETDALTQLFHVLDDGSVQPTPEALGALLREMSQDAIQSVLVWIGQLRHPHAKAALVRSLEVYFLESPSTLEPMTSASDRAVVQRAVAIAGKLKDPEFAEPVAKALEHRDAGIRRLAVSALSSIGTPAALKLAVRAIEDEDVDVRMNAFEAFTQRPVRGVARTLSTYLTTRDLESIDLSERRALFVAFATSNGPAGVPTLETVLLAKGGLARRASPQTRACAALALGVIDSPAARFALESATKEKDPLVRSAAGAALRSEGMAS